jgi:hypothetical protein
MSRESRELMISLWVGLDLVDLLCIYIAWIRDDLDI